MHGRARDARTRALRSSPRVRLGNMQRIARLAALLLLSSGCTNLRECPQESRPPSVDGAEAAGARPHGLDRWFRPEWGPPYTVSNGYAWVYEPCR